MTGFVLVSINALSKDTLLFHFWQVCAKHDTLLYCYILIVKIFFLIFCNISASIYIGDSMNTIGNNIKQYREFNSLTQKELSDYLKCPREMISYYENDTRVPSLDVLNKISNLFGIELCDLIEESSEIHKENLVLAFRKDSKIAENYETIASFKKIIKNYMKMERLSNEYGL